LQSSGIPSLHHIGQSRSVAIGYSAPASVGAALANRKHGRISINFQRDGDLMYLPGVLWTAAHHWIPMLTVMHNNHVYNTEECGASPASITAISAGAVYRTGESASFDW
jgi:thiamine pyrophosphate-dependent acetolactate synthase large subunit-like protein